MNGTKSVDLNAQSHPDDGRQHGGDDFSRVLGVLVQYRKQRANEFSKAPVAERLPCIGDRGGDNDDLWITG